MGNPKSKWSPCEEDALTRGVTKYGPGRWIEILTDQELGLALRKRSNIDLKDKWRNMNMAKDRQARNMNFGNQCMSCSFPIPHSKLRQHESVDRTSESSCCRKVQCNREQDNLCMEIAKRMKTADSSLDHISSTRRLEFDLNQAPLDPLLYTSVPDFIPRIPAIKYSDHCKPREDCSTHQELSAHSSESDLPHQESETVNKTPKSSVNELETPVKVLEASTKEPNFIVRQRIVKSTRSRDEIRKELQREEENVAPYYKQVIAEELRKSDLNLAWH